MVVTMPQMTALAWKLQRFWLTEEVLNNNTGLKTRELEYQDVFLRDPMVWTFYRVHILTSGTNKCCPSSSYFCSPSVKGKSLEGHIVRDDQYSFAAVIDSIHCVAILSFEIQYFASD